MGSRSRRKGAAGERELAALLSARGFAAKRTCQRQGGPDSPDVRAEGLEGFHVEVKRTERLDVCGALAQAARDSRGRRAPLIFHRRNRTPWLAILPADAFLALLTAAAGRPFPEALCREVCRAWANAKPRAASERQFALELDSGSGRS